MYPHSSFIGIRACSFLPAMSQMQDSPRCNLYDSNSFSEHSLANTDYQNVLRHRHSLDDIHILRTLTGKRVTAPHCTLGSAFRGTISASSPHIQQLRQQPPTGKTSRYP
ncbi:expressed protein [Echinococcus multilocularis]|uniref:Expressed protein n=1 Tax=Echinococcus multilocularis TaxID=6211 RepID=A0A068XWG6_ECHMU|nr:expressed protein [Echinococcus multilocularis]